MAEASILAGLVAYVGLCRILIHGRNGPAATWRHAAFALLNLTAAYLFFYREKASGSAWFLLYVILVFGQYLAMVLWSERPCWIPWLAFLTPIAVLALVRYLPLNALAMHSAWLKNKLAFEPDYRLSARFVGLSYLAFRTSHLVLEVRNRLVRRPGIWEYLGFAFFAPTLSVGPINPFREHQRAFAEEPLDLPADRALFRVLVGAVKYRFLGPVLNQLTYSSLLLDGHAHPWVDLPVAAIAYYLFLYCNFSGFCDMAIGIAGLMGIPVLENFDSPFLARNIKDFWNRWHITLSQWMRDVVFSPLSKALVGLFGPAQANHAIALTIFIVFLLVGVWHGVGWNYLAFGAMHAVGVVTNHYYTVALKKWIGRKKFAAYNASRLIHAIAVALTFIYVAASLALFANDLPTLKQILAVLRSG